MIGRCLSHGCVLGAFLGACVGPAQAATVVASYPSPAMAASASAPMSGGEPVSLERAGVPGRPSPRTAATAGLVTTAVLTTALALAAPTGGNRMNLVSSLLIAPLGAMGLMVGYGMAGDPGRGLLASTGGIVLPYAVALGGLVLKVPGPDTGVGGSYDMLSGPSLLSLATLIGYTVWAGGDIAHTASQVQAR